MAKRNTAENKDETYMNETTEVNDGVDFSITFNRNFNRDIVRQNPITTREELRSLVRQYYDIQDYRISSGNRQFQLNEEDDDENVKKKNDKKKNISFEFASAGLKQTEEVMGKWIEDYVKRDPIGRWLISIKGIGPILAGGLLSYIDISKCQTAGSIWRYAGIEGHRSPRKKGVKLDYNPNFKVLCWKCGESFQKVSGFESIIVKGSDGKSLKDENGKIIRELKLDEFGNPIPKSLYGHLYTEKLKWYIEKNEAGGFADTARLVLEEKKIENVKTRECYESGKLPMAHLISMAKRYAVKIFLSHLFTVWYEYENGKSAPRPFVEVHCGHVHIIEPPSKEILGLN